jgi:hypothetical protein
VFLADFPSSPEPGPTPLRAAAAMDRAHLVETDERERSAAFPFGTDRKPQTTAFDIIIHPVIS